MSASSRPAAWAIPLITSGIIDTVQGIASLDTGRKQAQVLLGGTSGSVDTVIRHVPASFGKKVDVTASRSFLVDVHLLKDR